MISVLVVNDQRLDRLALRLLLTAEPELNVVGEAASGAEAVHLCAALDPDVALIGSRLLKADGIEAIRHIARLPPRVLALTSPRREGYAYAALRAGAGGVLVEDAALDELVAAIRVVAAGGAVVSPGLTRALIHAVRRLDPAVELGVFTARERDVLIAVASGWSNAEIAQLLSIAPTTVKCHVSRILTKLGARARVQAVTFAYESGLVRPAA
ncbi:LuxR C-terminal-related transcriptional regulator [Streptomyces sp. NPDC056390]|uniref:LuxR C-terminal-related transcriptional regulator n=1 Tax=Streptomyces sp. NPDC056390 TaxID=3345806 RepID=UPI0035E18F70